MRNLIFVALIAIVGCDVDAISDPQVRAPVPPERAEASASPPTFDRDDFVRTALWIQSKLDTLGDVIARHNEILLDRETEKLREALLREMKGQKVSWGFTVNSVNEKFVVLGDSKGESWRYAPPEIPISNGYPTFEFSVFFNVDPSYPERRVGLNNMSWQLAHYELGIGKDIDKSFAINLGMGERVTVAGIVDEVEISNDPYYIRLFLKDAAPPGGEPRDLEKPKGQAGVDGWMGAIGALAKADPALSGGIDLSKYNNVSEALDDYLGNFPPNRQIGFPQTEEGRLLAAQYRLRVADRNWNDGLRKTAIFEYQQIIEMHPNSPAAEQAKDRLDSISGKRPARPPAAPDDLAATWLRMGDVLAKTGKVNAAADYYRRIVAEYPDTPAAEEARGRLAGP